MSDDLVSLFAARTGHFRFESGHHGDLWLDLDSLFLRPGWLRPFVVELAKRLAVHPIDAVCGPLIGGAFVAHMVAAELDVEFWYAERIAPPSSDALGQVEYRIPSALRNTVRGKSVAVVDDVINAASAVRRTVEDLRECGASPVALGALLVLGSSAATFATELDVPLESIAHLPNRLWAPAECPLCASGVPLDDGGLAV